MVGRVKSDGQGWAAEPVETEFPGKCPVPAVARSCGPRDLGALGGVRGPTTTEIKDILFKISSCHGNAPLSLYSTDAKSLRVSGDTPVLHIQYGETPRGQTFNIGDPKILTAPSLVQTPTLGSGHARVSVLGFPVLEERFRCRALGMT